MKLNNIVGYIVCAITVTACSKSVDEAPNIDKDTSSTGAKSVSKAHSNKMELMHWVYIDNGAIQCKDTALKLEETTSKLIDNSIDVVASECATITGTMVAAQCGLKDLNIHIHKIAEKDVKKARGIGFEPVENISHHGNKRYEIIPCGS